MQQELPIVPTKTASHTCHADGCNRPIPPLSFMCGYHWKMIPHKLRVQIWRYYRPGQEVDKQPSKEWLGVAKQAMDAIKAFEEKEQGK